MASSHPPEPRARFWPNSTKPWPSPWKVQLCASSLSIPARFRRSLCPLTPIGRWSTKEWLKLRNWSVFRMPRRKTDSGDGSCRKGASLLARGYLRGKHLQLIHVHPCAKGSPPASQHNGAHIGGV